MQPRNNSILFANALHSAHGAATAVEAARDTRSKQDSQIALDAVADYTARRDEVVAILMCARGR